VSEQILFVGVAAFVASVVSGFGGFGGSYILLIALTPIVGVKAVIPLIAVFAVCGNLSRLVIYRKHIAWKFAIQFTLASLPGVYLGARILAWIPERALLVLFALILLSAIPLRRYLKKVEFKPGLATVIGLGLIFGLISGTAAGAGMFVIAALSSVGMAGLTLLGTDAAIGMVNAVSRVGAYISLGLLNKELILAGLLMGATTVPGTWLASRAVEKMGDRAHGRVIEILILGGGLWMLYTAIFVPEAV